MELVPYIIASFIGAFAVQQVAFAFSVRTKRVDVVDIAWGLSFLGGYLAMQVYAPSGSSVVLLVGALVAVWALRLSWHIFKRFRRTSKQDERYTKLMSAWPKDNRVARSYVSIFTTQALLATAVGLPVTVTYAYEPAFGPFVVVGVVVWIIGFVLESVADYQLKQFILSAKSDGVMRTGLWSYSRHPNYFGEITMWWGVALIACVTPLWWLGLLGAALITYLISFVSGIPLAEERSASRKGWEEYKRHTSPLIPWPPRP